MGPLPLSYTSGVGHDVARARYNVLSSETLSPDPNEIRRVLRTSVLALVLGCTAVTCISNNLITARKARVT